VDKPESIREGTDFVAFQPVPIAADTEVLRQEVRELEELIDK
jgi:hypothetical protein